MTEYYASKMRAVDYAVLPKIPIAEAAGEAYNRLVI
jgi:hypothetical protein